MCIKQRIKITVEYDGTNYFGWQSQRDKNTIQDSIESALKILFKKNIRISASGRTDTGVHAKNQIVHLDIPEYDLTRLKQSLNGLLAKDIVIKKAEKVESGFHARFDAVSRRYRYYIAQGSTAVNRFYS